MTAAETGFRRVLVALDASAGSRLALEVSADVATRLGAELVGLFVEDENLLRMAAFPATRVVAPGAAACELDVPMLERALRAAAAEARLSLEALAQRRAVRCAFRIVRGAVATEVVAGSETGDLVVVHQRVVGAAWGAIATEARASVLMVGARARDGEAVLAVYPVEPGWQEGVAAVARLAVATGRRLAVVPPPGVGADELERLARSLLASHGARWEAIALPGDADALVAALRARGGAVVAVPGGSVALAGEDVDRLLRRARCSMLVVR